VQKLARAIGAEGDFGWSCESAAHLYSLHVRPAWDNYKARLAAADPADPAAVAAHFPFARFFDDLPDHVPGQPLFAGVSRADDEETARGCFRHIRALFTHLDECRPLELLRTGHDRADFLLIKQARIVAMTCTHAALKRADLVRLGFSYDSVLMEEAAQVLEVETFIPLVLQADSARLKRVVLIGDHNQLPPIIRNMAFQRYALACRVVSLCVVRCH
jgi:intron-binding protein aquarius